MEPCVIPQPGSLCYKTIMWAMKEPTSIMGAL